MLQRRKRRNGPISDIGNRLLDHLVGAREKRFGDRQPERFGRREIDDQLELRRLLHWNIGGLRTPQNFIYQIGSVVIHAEMSGP